MKSKWEKEKDVLIDLVFNQNKSYEEIGKMYHCSGSNIKRVMKVTLGIEVPQRTSNTSIPWNKGKLQKQCAYCGKPISSPKKYCNQDCMGKHIHQQGYNKILNGDPEIMRANYNPKDFKKDILEEQDNKCAICGISPEWNGKSLMFILDHIDGHASNNKRDNLRCICPNCDSQLDTYKSKNKNGDRFYYRYRYNGVPQEKS